MRSLIGVTMSRYKKIIGTEIHSRKNGNLITDARLDCYILNEMSNLGMHETIKLKKCVCKILMQQRDKT
jgi:hypothetical protein